MACLCRKYRNTGMNVHGLSMDKIGYEVDLELVSSC